MGAYSNFMRRLIVGTTLVLLLMASSGLAQSLGNAGTIVGTVADPSGAVVPDAEVSVHNAATLYDRTVKSDATGAYRFANLPPNRYHLQINASGFAPYSQDVDIRNAIPVQLMATLQLGSANTSVNVEAAAETLETDPSAHVDVDRNQLQKLPRGTPGAGLSQAIVYSTGGVAADANGFFHPLGDHAQVSFVIDGQPISDQQSKVFSTQLPTSAVQSMGLITGAAQAEFGDKTSLVAQITTRSGLGADHVFGNLDTTYGSFGNIAGSAGLGFGSAKFGNFLAMDGLRSGRFLDTPEFRPIHAIGNNQTIFDRVDLQPDGKDVFHLNLFVARNWIQIPNSYDQLMQDQRQRVLTWSVAPGYQRTVNAHTLLTVNPYVRKDQFNYYPSRNFTADTPATQSQQRHLMNWGVKADVATVLGRHNIKYGFDLKQTRLLENFQFGITDPAFNSPCVDADGEPNDDPKLSAPGQCVAASLLPNPDFSAGLRPYDLSRGGRQFAFHAAGNINQYGFFGQDGITLGSFQVNLGLRVDSYDGLVPRPAYNRARASLTTSKKLARFCAQRTRVLLKHLLTRTCSFPVPLARVVWLAICSGRIVCRLRRAFETSLTAGFSKLLASTSWWTQITSGSSRTMPMTSALC